MLIPLAYLFTFSGYGTHLHGVTSGSVDQFHNQYNTPVLPTNLAKAYHEAGQLREPPFSLNTTETRDLVLNAIRATCHRHEWELLAAHVRSTHVHLVLRLPTVPERPLSQIKAAASRVLNNSPWKRESATYWAKHGSTRYLWQPAHVNAAVHYVVHEQGKAMTVFIANPDPSDTSTHVHGAY